jgi:hypothetical protein
MKKLKFVVTVVILMLVALTNTSLAGEAMKALRDSYAIGQHYNNIARQEDQNFFATLAPEQQAFVRRIQSLYWAINNIMAPIVRPLVEQARYEMIRSGKKVPLPDDINLFIYQHCKFATNENIEIIIKKVGAQGDLEKRFVDYQVKMWNAMPNLGIGPPMPSAMDIMHSLNNIQ